jgi:hypothetical protein
MPLTAPEAALTVARVGMLLLHTPPVGVLTRVVVLPAHTDIVPVIVAGVAFTVSSRVLIQPVASR